MSYQINLDLQGLPVTFTFDWDKSQTEKGEGIYLRIMSIAVLGLKLNPPEDIVKILAMELLEHMRQNPPTPEMKAQNDLEEASNRAKDRRYSIVMTGDEDSLRALQEQKLPNQVVLLRVADNVTDDCDCPLCTVRREIFGKMSDAEINTVEQIVRSGGGLTEAKAAIEQIRKLH